MSHRFRTFVVDRGPKPIEQRVTGDLGILEYKEVPQLREVIPAKDGKEYVVEQAPLYDPAILPPAVLFNGKSTGERSTPVVYVWEKKKSVNGIYYGGMKDTH